MACERTRHHNVDWTDGGTIVQQLKTLCCFSARCSNGGYPSERKPILFIEGGGSVAWTLRRKNSYVKRRNVSDNGSNG